MIVGAEAGLEVAEYVRILRNIGIEAVLGSGETCWVPSEPGAVTRVPTFCLAEPAPGEVDDVLRATRCAIATYLRQPGGGLPANAWLYLCSNVDYSLSKLAAPVRRNVRRGLRELTVGPLTGDELLQHGVRAFCDTRRRIGLADGTPARFRRYFRPRILHERELYLGAWRDGRLAAFMTVLHMDDWIELGSFSMDAMLPHRPNDALMYTVLSEYLAGGRCTVVSYGLSSIQTSSAASGLHRFKRKFGFTPVPVHRAFVLHPAVRPLANRATLSLAHWTLLAALRFWPRDARLKKAEGALACMRGTGMFQREIQGDIPQPRGQLRRLAHFSFRGESAVVVNGYRGSRPRQSHPRW